VQVQMLWQLTGAACDPSGASGAAVSDAVAEGNENDHDDEGRAGMQGR
jgi:hypothetical protein